MRDTILVHNCDELQFMLNYNYDSVEYVTESPYFFSVKLTGLYWAKSIVKNDMTGEEIQRFRDYCKEHKIKITKEVHARDSSYAPRKELK